MYCRNCGKPVKALSDYGWWVHTQDGYFRCDGEPVTIGNTLTEEAQPMEVSDYFKLIKKYESTTKTETNGRINS